MNEEKITAVSIAKDALKHLNSGRFIAQTGDYMNIGRYEDMYQIGDKPLRPILKRRGFTCKVCAIGGLFAAFVYRHNQAKAEESCDRDPMTERLKPYFPDEQLGYIECAFERSTAFISDAGDPDLADLAVDFGARFDDPRDRMVAIMEYIVANDGVFMKEPDARP